MVITGLTRNQVDRKVSWVRIPPPPPEKQDRPSGRFCFFACGIRTHMSSPSGSGAQHRERVGTSAREAPPAALRIPPPPPASPRTPYRSRRLFMLRRKSRLSLISSRLLSKPNPLCWASVWFWGRAVLFFLWDSNPHVIPERFRCAAPGASGDIRARSAACGV